MTRFNLATKFFYSITFVLLIHFVTATAFANDDQRALTFGVAPKYDIEKLERAWRPLLARVSELSKVNLEFITADSMEEFERKLANGEFDIVYLNPYQYTRYHDVAGYNAFAKQAEDKENGVIVVHKDSVIQSINDLNTKQMAFPGDQQYGANGLTQAQLVQNGVNVDPKYVDSEFSVFRAVLKGDIEAGSGVSQTLSYVNPNVHDQLRVVWSSKPYSSGALAAHPRVNRHFLASIKSAMLSLNSDTRGRNLLRSVRLKGIDSADDNEWNDVRSLQSTLTK